jgi:serine/threonine-protein kinase
MSRPLHFGPYRVVRRIGGRSGCALFEASGPRGEPVALKVIDFAHGAPAVAEEALQRFRREAALVQRLTHPNIVRMLAHGEDATHAWLALELVRGRVLSEAMRGSSQAAVLACIRRVLESLAYLHAHGIVHRDLKPANVVVTQQRGPVLCDFGLAHVEDSVLTQRGDLLGTPAYMAPECFLGEVVDARSDLFAVGVMLYELLTGRPPFTGENSGEIMLAIVQDDPMPPSCGNPSVSPALDAILRTALAKPRHLRFADAAAFAGALREVQVAEADG